MNTIKLNLPFGISPLWLHLVDVYSTVWWTCSSFFILSMCVLYVRMFQLRLRYETEQNSTSIDLSVRCRRANTNEYVFV